MRNAVSGAERVSLYLLYLWRRLIRLPSKSQSLAHSFPSSLPTLALNISSLFSRCAHRLWHIHKEKLPSTST